MACYIRLQEGDCLVESGEFAETQVQRPPEQYSSFPRIYRLVVPRLERLENLLDFCVEGRSLDLPNSKGCEAIGIAYLIHRPRF